MANYSKGVYTVKNKEKYIGKKHPVFRSSWEQRFMNKLDSDPRVKQWCSECVVVPYYFNGKLHRYFPDFLVVYTNGIKEVVEIKPHRETQKPRKTKKKSRNTILYEQLTYAKNTAKWEAAKKFCTKKGWVFKIITEKTL